MITKVSPVKFSSYNLVSRRDEYNPAFGAVRLYNERSGIDVFKIKMNKMCNNVRRIWDKFISSSSSGREIGNDEIEINNRFIAKIQNKISSYGVPAGEFRTNSGDVVIIKMLKDGNKRADIYSAADQNRNLPIRSVIVDDYGIIQRYETSYPWRIFVKSGNDYLCAENTDKCFKEIASSPFFKWNSVKEV